MNCVMPQSPYYRDYRVSRLSNQTNGLVPRIHMDSSKMNIKSEQHHAENLPSLPPLIPMNNRSPPPLCSIPKGMQEINSYKSSRYPSSQHPQQRPYNAPIQGSYQTSTIPQCSGSPVNVGSRPERTSPNMESNPRKRRSEGTNRELIDMVKKQLAQLNKTLAALERNNDENDDDENLHVDQITTPIEMMNEVEEVGIRSRNHNSSPYSDSHRRGHNENERFTINYNQQNSPNFNQLMPSGIDSPQSSISSLEDGTDQIKRYDPKGYQNDNIRMGSYGLSKNVLESNSRLTLSPRSLDEAKRQKLDNSLPNKKLTSLCQVCGDQAPEHIHYGSVSCFSCRAFFRRSVSKSHLYVCPGNQRCSIVVTTRKNCQYCRYHACLNAGMRPTWVLTDKEKLERNKNKKNAQNSSNEQQPNQCKDNNSDKASLSLCRYTPADDHYIHDILLKQGTAECKQDFGKHTSHAIAKCLQTEDGNLQNIKLPRWAALEIFRVQYGRFSKFARLISDFHTLTTETQDLLLRNNLGSIASIRLASIFRQKNNNTDKNLNFSSNGGISFISQLGEMGFDEKMANEIGSQVSQSSCTLTLEQVFRATDLSHLGLHRRVFQSLDRLISCDERAVLLYQIINLFNPSNIGEELDPKERRKVEAIQEKWTNLLLGYSQRKFGFTKAMMLLPKLILLTFELKLLSEKNRIDE